MVRCICCDGGCALMWSEFCLSQSNCSYRNVNLDTLHFHIYWPRWMCGLYFFLSLGCLVPGYLFKHVKIQNNQVVYFVGRSLNFLEGSLKWISCNWSGLSLSCTYLPGRETVSPPVKADAAMSPDQSVIICRLLCVFVLGWIPECTRPKTC